MLKSSRLTRDSRKMLTAGSKPAHAFALRASDDRMTAGRQRTFTKKGTPSSPATSRTCSPARAPVTLYLAQWSVFSRNVSRSEEPLDLIRCRPTLPPCATTSLTPPSSSSAGSSTTTGVRSSVTQVITARPAQRSPAVSSEAAATQAPRTATATSTPPAPPGVCAVKRW